MALISPPSAADRPLAAVSLQQALLLPLILPANPHGVRPIIEEAARMHGLRAERHRRYQLDQHPAHNAPGRPRPHLLPVMPLRHELETGTLCAVAVENRSSAAGWRFAPRNTSPLGRRERRCRLTRGAGFDALYDASGRVVPSLRRRIRRLVWGETRTWRKAVRARRTGGPAVGVVSRCRHRRHRARQSIRRAAPLGRDGATNGCPPFEVLTMREHMARELEGKVAVVTGAASGIGLASSEAMLAAGARVVMVDRDRGALQALGKKYGGAVIPLLIDLLDPKDCATLLPRVMEAAGGLDILHANAGSYVGGELVDNDTDSIDRMLNLNVNVVMKNVRDVLPHMIARRTGDIIVTVPWRPIFRPGEPVYASSKWAINCFIADRATPGLQARHPRRLDLARSGHQCASRRLASRETEAGQGIGSLLEADEVAQVLIFMLTRPRGMTIRDVVMLPTNFDL